MWCAMKQLNKENNDLCWDYFNFLATRAIHSQPASHDDGDYDVITAYVMEDNNSVVQEHDLHSGPPSIKVSKSIIYYY